MSDNLKRYLALFQALKQLCPTEPQGNARRHLCVLEAMMSGIAASRRTHLPAIASKMPAGKQRQSRIKRRARWLKNDQVSKETLVLPFAKNLLAGLPDEPLVLVMEASEVGRGCLAWVPACRNGVVSVLYRKRALPLGWIVIKGKKGHFAQEVPVKLLGQVANLMPPGRDVLFLGDGAFDGCDLLEAVSARGWSFVCRRAKNVPLCEEEEWFGFAELSVQTGELIALPALGFTRANSRSVMAMACWEPPYKEPLFLVTNRELAAEALFWYKQRFSIETFFCDQIRCASATVSRGFHRAHSPISDPKRMSRLLIATCLAYIWLVSLGELVNRKPLWLRQVHRVHRCDLSLFQLGLAWLDQCLDQGNDILVAFNLPQLRKAAKSVR